MSPQSGGDRASALVDAVFAILILAIGLSVASATFAALVRQGATIETRVQRLLADEGKAETEAFDGR